jgi:hypothetical protein
MEELAWCWLTTVQQALEFVVTCLAFFDFGKFGLFVNGSRFLP